jgi:hypothetical protein
MQGSRRQERDTKTRQQKAMRDATPDLVMKHSDAILATYKRRQMKHMKHVSETLAKTHEKKHFKTIANILNI